jgi:hypothetical protein
MELLVRAFPVLAGKEPELRSFARALQTTRAAEAADFYERFGVARESWHLQETPHGPWVIGVTQIPERPIEAAAEEYAGSQDPFDRWFKDQVKLVTGIDPDETPLGPPTESIFDTANLGGPGDSPTGEGPSR